MYIYIYELYRNGEIHQLFDDILIYCVVLFVYSLLFNGNKIHSHWNMLGYTICWLIIVFNKGIKVMCQSIIFLFYKAILTYSCLDTVDMIFRSLNPMSKNRYFTPEWKLSVFQCDFFINFIFFVFNFHKDSWTLPFDNKFLTCDIYFMSRKT